MVKKKYVPERGDLIWIDFSPVRGHEQDGRRPALVLSARDFNEHVGRILCCPVTSRERGNVFEVSLQTKKIQGVVLTDQARSIDWHARNVSYITKASEVVVERVGTVVAKIAQGR